jgi:SOS-response transcriptional repressor LexA
MSRSPVLAALALALLAAGCNPSPRPMTDKVTLSSVEDQKRDVARLRDRGVISYEDAARRQYEIQRGNYNLTDAELSFWRASIEIAMKVDRGEIRAKDYQRLIHEAYDRYVVQADKPA